MSWFWHPGGIYSTQYRYDFSKYEWVPFTQISTGKFRCDSFVYYLFKEGAKRKIDYNGAMLPINIFNSFIEQRYSSSNFIPSIKVTNTRVVTNQVDLENRIKNLLSKSTMEIQELDILSYNYVISKDIDRLRKINFLWEEIKYFQDDEIKFEYLIDTLTYLKPIEMVDGLIEAYESINDVAKKEKIISLMADSVVYNSLSEANNLNKIQIDDILKIQKFIKNILNKPKNDSLFFQALISYASTNSASNTLDVISKIKIKSLKNSINEKFIYYTIAFNAIYSDVGLEREERNFIKKIPNEDRNIFNTYICLKLNFANANFQQKAQNPIINKFKRMISNMHIDCEKYALLNIQGLMGK